MLLFLAMRAYNVSPDIIGWKDDMYKYNSLTEWVFWDRVKATKVDSIGYKAFSQPARTPGKQWQLHLRDVLPEVVEAGTHTEGTRRGMPRTVLHALLYYSQSELAELAYFDDKVYATRSGPLPSIPKAAAKDKRCNIEPAYMDSLWVLAGDSEWKDILFVWMLSLMIKKFYVSSIVTAIIDLHPEIVTRRLHKVYKDKSAASEYMLVYYMPGPKCLGRADINQYQSLMRLCIERWVLVQKMQTKKSSSDTNVYIVTGAARPVRNLIRLEQEAIQGRCKAIPLLDKPNVYIQHLNYDEVEHVGHKVMPAETDEEFNARIRDQYNGEFWMPDNISSASTARVNNASKSAAATAVTCSLKFVFGHERSEAGGPYDAAESRLRLKQTLPPPPVGNTMTKYCERAV